MHIVVRLGAPKGKERLRAKLVDGLRALHTAGARVIKEHSRVISRDEIARIERKLALALSAA